MSADPRDHAHRGKELLPYAEAVGRLLATAEVAVDAAPIPLDRALGRVLAQDVAMDRPEPPVRRSAMDGFALRSADGSQPRRILGAVYAGSAEAPAVGAGETVAVMTGGTVADGADAVVPVERVRREGEQLEVLEEPAAGQHVRAAGEMGDRGRVLLRAGHRLRVPDLAAVAGCGVDPVQVYQRPGFTVLSTGDEVVPWTEAPAPHQVRDSNRLASVQQLAAGGGDCRGHHHLPDDPAALEAGVAAALARSPLVVTIGGVSMGDKDHLPGVFEALGVERSFHGVSVQPGKPVWAGRRGGSFVLGLPGNPVSSFVILELFGLPLLQRLGGAEAVEAPRPLEAGVSQSSKRARKRPRFLPADLATDADGRTLVRARPEAGSGDWTAMAGAEALLFLEPGAQVDPGDPVRFLRLA